MVLKVAVIGGSGFIGQAAVHAFGSGGHETINLDVVHPPGSAGRSEYFDLTGVGVGELDRLAEVDLVVIAAGMMAGACERAPDAAWVLNVDATGKLIRLLAQIASPPQVVFFSSGMVYDSAQPPPHVESGPVQSDTIYTASKLTIERLLAELGRSQGLQSLILRPFTVYGRTGMSGERGHLFGRWLEAGRRGEPITVYGDGSQVVDPVPVELVAEACVAYAELPTEKRSEAPVMTVNVSSGGYVTVRQLAELFVASGNAKEIRYVPAPGEERRRGWGDAARLEWLLGRQLSRNPVADVSQFLQSLLD